MADQYRAWAQLDPDMALPETVATTVAARTRFFDDWMGIELQRRGVTLAWTRNLPWLLERAGMDPSRVPDDPYAGGGAEPVPTTGQIWPR